jgi:hypothetical protein
MDWKTTRFYALLTLLVSLGFAAAAGAQETSTEETTTVVEPSPVLPMSLSYFQPRYSEARWDVHRIKANKCRSHVRPHVWPAASEVAPGYREERLARTKARRAAARELLSQCFVIPAWPWLALASCESGQTWNYNGPSGFDGGFQFLPSTWNMAKRLVRGASVYAYAYQAPAYVQYLVAKAWLAVTSWLQWPVCSAKIGAR